MINSIMCVSFFPVFISVFFWDRVYFNGTILNHSLEQRVIKVVRA